MSKIYKKARENYKPENIKVLFIGESPPPDPSRYFYFEDVPKHDNLFKNTMEALYCCEFKNYDRKPEMKRYFLDKFMKDGYFLIDAIDHPIENKKKLTKKQLEALIDKNKQRLIKDIQRLSNISTKIVLLTANVYDLLFRDLSKVFNILDVRLRFPVRQWRIDFIRDLSNLLLKEHIIKKCVCNF